MKQNITVKELRHRAEMPMLITCLVLTIIAVVGILIAILLGWTPEEWATLILIGLASPFIVIFYGYRKTYWETISNSVEITENQFPEVYEAYIRLAQQMGFGQGKGVMATIPRLYMKNGNGAINAFASKCQIHKGYVSFNSELLEIAYTQNDLSGIEFVLAHELGHIKCGHVNAWRTMVHPLANLLWIGKSLTRSQEWTADRCAYYYAPQGKRSMMVLIAGKNLYKQVDFDAYIESIANHKDGFWLKLENFLADHAVGFRRMQAIKETEEKGWDVHGKML